MNQRELQKRPSFSPPSPPTMDSNVRSPTSGYSKSILSAIKDISFEGMNRDPTQPSTNSPNIQQPESSNTNIANSRQGEPSKSGDEGKNQPDGNQQEGKPQNSQEQQQQQQVVRVEEEESSSRQIDGGVGGGRGNAKRRQRERRSISCDPSSSQLPTKTPKSDTADLNFSQRAQSINVIGASDQQRQQKNAISMVSSSQFSSRVSSSISVRSGTNETADNALKRSQSIASSVCSKEERSSSTNTSATPKIRISTCAKALYACSNGQLQELMSLVKENPDLINYQYPYCYRYSCLHIAAKAGDKNIVRYLIRNGANLNARDNWATPLHLAAQAGQVEMTRYLRDHGADASIRDAHGNLYSNYLSDEAHRIHGKSMTQMRFSKNQNMMVFDSEDDELISSGSNRSHLSHSSLPTKHHHHISGTFKKPIKVVKGLFNKI